MLAIEMIVQAAQNWADVVAACDELYRALPKSVRDMYMLEPPTLRERRSPLAVVQLATRVMREYQDSCHTCGDTATGNGYVCPDCWVTHE